MVKAMIVAVLLLIARADYKTKKIPLYLLLSYLGLVLAGIWGQPGFSPAGLLSGAATVSVPMLVLYLLIPGSWGRGDLYLTAVTGLYLGMKPVLLAAYLAIMLGGCYGIGLILLKRKPADSRIPFAPFWVAGTFAVLLWGEAILWWYGQFLGPISSLMGLTCE